MRRRAFTASLLAVFLFARRVVASAAQSVRGRFTPGATPQVIVAGGGSAVRLAGDAGTMLVLADARLKDADLEAVGTLAEPGLLRVDPLHKRALFVHRGGLRLMITYWCEVCSIRTFTPGVCMCCQDETALDLKQKLDSDDLRSR